MPSSTRGQFLTIEGTEGVGKSTNIAFIESYLKDRGIDLVTTREPGGTPLAEQIRALLLENRDEKMNEQAELLLVFAARAQHLHTVIMPALAQGKWVLCDRFTDATYAYQGGGRGLSLSLIEQLEQQVQGNIRPHLTLLLDIDVSIGLERAGRRGDLDRFEQEHVDFFERVRQAYLTRARSDSSRYGIVNAECSLPEVQAQIATYLEALLSQ